jgi:hypothetical protein
LSQPGGGTGDEPGVDVRSRRDEEAYGHLKGGTTVTIVDYANAPPPKDEGGRGGNREREGVEEEEEEAEEGDMNFRVEFPGERLREWLGGEGKRKMGSDGRPVGVRWSESKLCPYRCLQISFPWSTLGSREDSW